MLTFDPSQDYLLFDFLITATYYHRTGDSTFAAGVAINNCWFQDTTRVARTDRADLRQKFGALTIWMNEWPDATLIPSRGDKFSVPELQFSKPPGETISTNSYIVTDVDIDTERSRAMRLSGYRINDATPVPVAGTGSVGLATGTGRIGLASGTGAIALAGT